MTTSADALSMARVRGFQLGLSSLDMLTGHGDYNAWSREVFQLICSNELQGYLDGTQPVPAATNVEASARYRREANCLTAGISGLLDNSTFALISHLGDMPKSKDLWGELERICRNKDTNRAPLLLSELRNTRFSQSDDPERWFVRLHELYTGLLDTKFAQSEAVVCHFMIEALLPSYPEIAISLQKEPDAKWTIANFSSLIRQRLTYLKHLDLRPGSGMANSAGAYMAVGTTRW
ncbi:hypothetical protein FRC08_005610 [Ceratobasidium sp. 394]|nr:hypothetical protein FRC08_005610 [Ceratobasidium sp. 394]